LSRWLRLLVLVLASGFLFVVAGCNETPTGLPGSPAEPVKADHDHEHAHKASAHGGRIVPVGRDNYHAEVVFEQGGTLRFYTLGHDEAKVIQVEAQPLQAFVKGEAAAEAVSLVLAPEPQPGDDEGQTSRFVGHLPRDLWGRPVEVTIPTLRIGGERFRVGFTSTDAAAVDGAPAKVGAEEERKLYLTAAGKYNEEDVRANGNRTASEKFQGLKAAHDLKPQPGDLVCPVTLTRANPACTWVVGGQTYTFCCPPCVDEFVRRAKEHPETVKDPEEYRKK
jgi:hypothetical protein